jgi:plasmid stability protein
MYIMKRTQLYLDEDLWKTLHIRASQSGRSISELVRLALREKYLGTGSRQDAMQAFVGIRKGRRDLPVTETYIRELRKGGRLERLSG